MNKNLQTALIAATILSLFLSVVAIKIATEVREARDDQMSRLENNVKLLDELVQQHEHRINKMLGVTAADPTSTGSTVVETEP